MTVSNICILGTIAVYLVGMLIIGFRCARKNESSADFYLGGRKLGPLVTAMSAEASDMSSYLLMGLPAFIDYCSQTQFVDVSIIVSQNLFHCIGFSCAGCLDNG